MQHRRIWTYGWGRNECMPPYIAACHYSMKKNSGCEVVIVTPDNIEEYVRDLPQGFFSLRPPHQADIFRIRVLSQFGGMYLDADTVVLRSLVPLFDRLRSVELVGMDWKPRSQPQKKWQSLGVSVMGPMKPHLPFMRCAERKQRRLMSERTPFSLTDYPFGWEDLLAPIVNECFNEYPPVARIGDGASSWFALVGGPDWHGGDLKSPLRPLDDIKYLPDCELFTFANSIMPDEVKWAPIEVVLSQGTLLSQLFLRAMGIEEPLQATRVPVFSQEQ